MAVVKPPEVKAASEVASAIHHWEGRIADMKNRYNEDIGDKMKLVILIAMMPKDFLGI